MKNERYRIGEFLFEISYPKEVHIPSNFQQFRVMAGCPAYFYRISCADTLPAFQQEAIARRDDLCVLPSETGGEIRQLGVRGTAGFYACYMERGSDRADIVLKKSELDALCFDTVFTSLLALERRMLERDSLILHCSCLRYRGQAILFSGPSGIGKSTQANLWRTYRGAEIMNGDRALLRRSAGKWIACGWPVCGSSGICRLGDAPIRSIVMLEQGARNHSERLPPVRAFSLLYGQTTINRWNPNAVTHSIDLIENLITEVPVYQLTCTPTEAAVDCLESALGELGER